MACKGLCQKYKAKKGYRAPRYADDQKRCQMCDVFIRYPGNRCPCCGFKLRVTPRSKIYRIKLKQSKEIGSLAL